MKIIKVKGFFISSGAFVSAPLTAQRILKTWRKTAYWICVQGTTAEDDRDLTEGSFHTAIISQKEGPMTAAGAVKIEGSVKIEESREINAD